MANHRLRKSRHRSVGRMTLAFAGISAAGVLGGLNAPMAQAATPTASVTLASFHTALTDPPRRGGDRDNCRDERHGLDNDRFCLPERRHIRHHHHFGGFGGHHFGGFGGHHFGNHDGDGHGEHGHPGQHHDGGHPGHHEGPHGH